MPMSIEIDKTDLVAVDFTINTIDAGKRVAIMRATNDVLGGVRTEATRLIFAKVTLKSAVIRKHFSLNKMQKSNLSADVKCVGDPLPLINYGARQVNKGVSVKVLKSGKRDTIRHAFIATLGSGHTGAFWREGNVRGGSWKTGRRRALPSPSTGSMLREYQLPIRQLYGPAVPAIFDDDDIMGPTLSNADVRMAERLNYHTDRLLDKAR